jgi:transposase
MSCLRDLRAALPGPERSNTERRWRGTTSSPQEPKSERTPRRCGSGGSVLFLPPYSPDFSPIEEAFSKVKDILRPVVIRTREAPLKATGWALDALSAGRCGLVRTAATTLSIIIAMKTALKQFEEYQQVRQVS